MEPNQFGFLRLRRPGLETGATLFGVCVSQFMRCDNSGECTPCWGRLGDACRPAGRELGSLRCPLAMRYCYYGSQKDAAISAGSSGDGSTVPEPLPIDAGHNDEAPRGSSAGMRQEAFRTEDVAGEANFLKKLRANLTTPIPSAMVQMEEHGRQAIVKSPSSGRAGDRTAATDPVGLGLTRCPCWNLGRGSKYPGPCLFDSLAGAITATERGA